MPSPTDQKERLPLVQGLPPRIVRRRGSTPSVVLSFLLLAPGLAIYGMYFVWPQLDLLGSSFQHNGALSFFHYQAFIFDSYRLGILVRTLALGATVVAITLVIGVPLAYVLARSESRWAPALLLLTTLPLMISVVVRSFSWMVLFFRNGVVSRLTAFFGVADPPLQLMYTFAGVCIALAQVLLPVMVVTVYGTIRAVNADYENAAISLGASSFTAFWLVTLRMARGGVVAGSLLVFALAISSYATPTLIGGVRVKVMASSIYEAAIDLLDWPDAAALSTILLVSVVVVSVLYAAAVKDPRTKSSASAR